MNNEGKCPTVGLNPDRLDCKKAVVLQATDPDAETGATHMLIAGRNGKPVDRDTKNSGTVSNCVAVAAPARPRGISQHSRLDIPQCAPYASATATTLSA